MNDYKAFVRRWIALRPGRGRGEFRKISGHLGVSSTLISQIFSGDKDLTPEQAADLTEYLGLNKKESRYFHLLVDHARAGSAKLKARLLEDIRESQRIHTQVAEVVTKDTDLSDSARATFYSSWLYSGIRNLSTIKGTHTVATLADRLQIPRAQVERVMEFLLKEGLCINDPAGGVAPGHRRTHTGSDSSLVIKHHQNWRLRAFDKMVFPLEHQLFYTGVMSLSKKDAESFRQEILALLKRLSETVADSPSETVRCIGIDWFEF